MSIRTQFARCGAVAAALIAAVTLADAQSPSASPPNEPPGDAARGRNVYDRYCTQCHGTRGDGKGEVAAWTQPKPRDFRQGVYKFRSTPMGTLPTTADLDLTIRDGLHGTLMPPFYALNRRAREDVIAYLQTFSPRWRQEQPGTPVIVSNEPIPTTTLVRRGHELFATACASCHGDGTGNGAAAAGMVDLWRSPVSPADLTQGRTKSARTARDIYLRIATGIDGTPMPGFAGTLPPEELWAVAHYVQALGPWQGSTRELREFVASLPPVPGVVSPDTAATDTTVSAEIPAKVDTVAAKVDTVTRVDTTAKIDTTARGVRPARAPDSAATGAARPVARRTRATIVVRMVGDPSNPTSFRFEPASVTARVGDVVRFVNVSGGPHNVAFWADSIPTGMAATLQKNMGTTLGPLSGALLTAPNAAYTISLAGLAPGTYRFYCLPHLAMKMTGRITMRP